MDVLGNNIANVNTAGYKDSRFEFKDILSQSIRGAAPAVQGGSGGTNPEQQKEKRLNERGDLFVNDTRWMH